MEDDRLQVEARNIQDELGTSLHTRQQGRFLRLLGCVRGFRSQDEKAKGRRRERRKPVDLKEARDQPNSMCGPCFHSDLY